MLGSALRQLSCTVTDQLCMQLTRQLSVTPTLCGKRKDRTGRVSFRVLRDPPLGPYKLLAPGVKVGKRVGPTADYRKIVHYPEDGKYTIKKLNMTKLGGRNPVTGRKVIQGVGGGSKRKYRWIDWLRIPKDWPKDKVLEERVVSISYDPNRTAKIALTGYEDKLRWQIATENMKAGDLIRSSTHIPSIPIKPVEGDSYPLGALPVGTTICLVQWTVGGERCEARKGAESAEILSKGDGRVVIRSNNKLKYSLDERCQCVAGTVSIHPLKACHIGTPNRSRWLGNTPRSGLWQRKDGRHGRKIRAPPPTEVVKEPCQLIPPQYYEVLMHAATEGKRGALPAKKRKFRTGSW